MNQDKHFYVEIATNGDRKEGIIKAENMEAGIAYLKTEYPNYRIIYIRETTHVIL